jgi:hypothetical protein
MINRQCARRRSLLLADRLPDHFDGNKCHRLADHSKCPAPIRPALPGALKPFENQIGVETMPTRYLRYRRVRRESLDDYPLSLFRAP